MEIDIEKRVDKAVELFMKGFGCAQSVTAAYADLYGLDEEQALRIGAGFGGGVGRLRMMCGAVSGMVILAGLHKGPVDGCAGEGKAECYKLVQDLLGRFKEKNGSIICAELLGVKAPDTPGNYMPSERNAEYYRKRPCTAKVADAARIFGEYLAGSKD